jgi:hypothetical protein
MAQRVSGYVRQANDAYDTPAWVTDAVVPHLRSLALHVWEPAAGTGKMVDALRCAGFRVTSTDIATGVDFLECSALPSDLIQAICTNPPYTYAHAFIEHALVLTKPVGGVVAMLLRCDFDRNAWRVIRMTGASSLVIHHAGWEGNREKGSIAIRAKSDVVTLVKLDAAGMALNLSWLRNRRGPKYANVGFAVASVALDGWNDKVLAATGDEVAVTSPQTTQAQTKGDQDLSLMIITLDLDLGGGATFTDWWHKMQAKYPQGPWSETSFRRKLNMLKDKGRVIEGGGKGEFYRLPQVVPLGGEESPPPESQSQSLPPTMSPHRGGHGDGGDNDRQSPPNSSHGGNGGNASESRGLQNQVEYDEQTDAEFEGVAGNDPASTLDTAAEQLVKKKG